MFRGKTNLELERKEQMNQNLKIIGSSHIAKQSINEVKAAIKNYQPDIVAVELDARRLPALFDKSKKKLSPVLIGSIGVFGYLFLLIANYVQKKLGKYVSIEPGSEMRTAVVIAKKNNLKLALIDQDIQITLRRLSKSFNISVLGRIVKDMFNSFFFPKREIQKLGMEHFDLSLVPDDKVVDIMIGELKKRYPSIYKVLIEDRNRVMATRLNTIMQQHPNKKILAVMGAGHKKGVTEILQSNKYDISFSYSIDCAQDNQINLSK
jgi:pheromone shutdown-related protein TraB